MIMLRIMISGSCIALTYVWFENPSAPYTVRLINKYVTLKTNGDCEKSMSCRKTISWFSWNRQTMLSNENIAYPEMIITHANSLVSALCAHWTILFPIIKTWGAPYFKYHEGLIFALLNRSSSKKKFGDQFPWLLQTLLSTMYPFLPSWQKSCPPK